jgi:hypothetical protein
LRWGWVAKSRWLILLPAHPLEKSPTDIRNASLHRLASRRTTVAEVAEVLGINAEAVRGRMCRSTLSLEWEGRTVYVLLDTPLDDRTTGDQPNDGTHILIAELQDQVRTLEEVNR